MQTENPPLPKGKGGYHRRHIFSHPDYYRRLRLLTESADPTNMPVGARGLVNFDIPPVGNCTPP